MGSFTANQAAPATRWKAITPNDATELAAGIRSLYIGTAGTIVVRGDDGADASFTVPAGAVLPVMAARVLATGTTAGGIVALY